MTELAVQLAEGLKSMSAWEITAVVLALAYLVLAIRENIACWFAFDRWLWLTSK